MKLGLKPFVPDKRDLLFANYRTGAALPKHPRTFGHEQSVTNWKMLGNDNAGCCVLAGAGHEHMLWNAANGRKIEFTDECTLSDYSAITGYDPSRPETDQGTDMREAAKYRQKVGIVDTSGNRHKIGAYVFIQSYEELLEATWLFGAVGYGFHVPQSAMDQFNRNIPWHNVIGSPDVGGHYVCGVANRAMIEFVTWARLQSAQKSFVTRNWMTGIAYVSEEYLSQGKSPEGFDLKALQTDLAILGRP